jgi:hypothetical protein
MYNYFMMGFGPTWVDASYGGSKVTRVPIPKVHINEKKTLKWKKMLKTNV